jgi:hypothetical protein
VKLLEEKIAIKTEQELIISLKINCFHADVECECTCEKHDSLSEEEVFAGPEKCICKQFHKPPKTPCGCLSEEDLQSIEDFFNPAVTIDILSGMDPKVFRKVPGMFKLVCSQGKKEFQILKRGEQIVRSSEETEEIIGIAHASTQDSREAKRTTHQGTSSASTRKSANRIGPVGTGLLK